MEDQYEEARRWLSIMWNKAYTDEERKTIKWIQEALWIDRDMRNS